MSFKALKFHLVSLHLKKKSLNILSGELPWWLKESGDSLDDKESTCEAEGPGLIPGSGRYPEEGNGYPFQYTCLENPMDRGAWWATVRGVTKSQTQLSN